MAELPNINFPVVLFDINTNKISRTHISKTHCIYFYSYQNFNVKILNHKNDDTLLYSVKQIGTILDIDKNVIFDNLNNFGYTLYIPENNSTVQLELSNEFSSIVYSFTLSLDNIITDENKYYTDLLTNYDLPAYDELVKAILPESNTSELIKRLLLEFREILKYKGTKESVKRFFHFIGYDDNITIYEEYKNPTTGIVTINPNKTTDVKDGNYHILYDNYEEVGYDKNNLPIRNIQVQDLDKFFEHLIYAISLANRYFTLKEQDITFFAIQYSSNIAFEPGITSTMNYIVEHDIHNFRKQLHINLWSHIDSITKKSHINNCLFINDNLERSEIKTYTENQDIFYNRNLYKIDREIFDDEVISDDIPLDKIMRAFGSVAHLKIESPNTYIQFEFTDKINPTNRIVFNKQFVTDYIYIKFAILNISTYFLNITVTDKYNNQEVFKYDFSLIDSVKRIDFETYNSSFVSDDMVIINNINLDVTSPSIVSTKPSQYSKNYILPLSDVPFDLSEYYNVPLIGFNKWLAENDNYALPSINLNFQADSVTETLPIDFSDNWLSVLAFKYDSRYTLYLKIFNINTCEYENIPINLLQSYYQNFDTFDSVYIVMMDVIDQENNNQKTPYYFITTTETGIDFSNKTYNFVLVDSENNEISIYDLQDDVDIFKRKIPVNYDFELFDIKSEIVPDFTTYVSEPKYDNISSNGHNLIKSIFPRLINIGTGSDSSNKDSDNFYLRLGDIIFCKLNKDYIVGEQNIKWKVFNSFTKELLFESDESTLKFRITENTIYDIMVEFMINNETHSIYKESMFSSF